MRLASLSSVLCLAASALAVPVEPINHLSYSDDEASLHRRNDEGTGAKTIEYLGYCVNYGLQRIVPHAPGITEKVFKQLTTAIERAEAQFIVHAPVEGIGKSTMYTVQILRDGPAIRDHALYERAWQTLRSTVYNQNPSEGVSPHTFVSIGRWADHGAEAATQIFVYITWKGRKGKNKHPQVLRRSDSQTVPSTSTTGLLLAPHAEAQSVSYETACTAEISDNLGLYKNSQPAICSEPRPSCDLPACAPSTGVGGFGSNDGICHGAEFEDCPCAATVNTAEHCGAVPGLCNEGGCDGPTQGNGVGTCTGAFRGCPCKIPLACPNMLCEYPACGGIGVGGAGSNDSECQKPELKGCRCQPTETPGHSGPVPGP